MPSSAAVLHRASSAATTCKAPIPQIKQLVSNSIPGLTAEKVTVVLVQAQAKPVAASASSVPWAEKATEKANEKAADKTAEPPMITPRLRAWLVTGAVMALLLALTGGGYFAWKALGRRRQIPMGSAVAVIPVDGEGSPA